MMRTRRDYEREGRGQDATMSAKHATMSAKDATISAKDATRSGKNATMNAKDATRTAKAATSVADAGTGGRSFEAHDRVSQILPGTPPSPPSEALPLSRLAFST